MKKLAILLLTVFTIGTAAACGCGSPKVSNNLYDKIKTESLNVQEIAVEQDEQNEQNEQNERNEQHKPECPDREKRDGEFPAPRRPHRRHGKRIPRPKSAYRK